MVRNPIVNKVADEGFKPEWNELLHMLERRSQRYSSAIKSGSESANSDSPTVTHNIAAF